MKRKELIDALKVVLSGVDQKNVLLEGSDSFVFDVDWIKTFNDSLSVSYPFKSGIKCMAKADILYKTLNKMNEDDITVEIKDDLLIVKDTTTELTMPMIEDKISPYIDNFKLKNIKWTDLPEDFLVGLNLCHSSAAKDSLFGSINSIYISDDCIVTSDNFRISKYIMKSGVKDTFLLSVNGSKELLKLSKPIKFYYDTNWVHFLNEDGVVFSLRTLMVDYPIEGLNKILDSVEFKDKYVFPEKIGESLDRVGLLSIEDDSLDYVVIKSKDGFLYLSGERQYGKIEDKIPIPKNSFPNNLGLKVSPKFLNSILSRSKEFYIYNKLILFKSDNYLHLVSTIV